MAGFFQNLSDLKDVIRTDRRIWACAGFLSIVTLVWFLTGSWREIEVPEEKAEKRYRIEENNFKSVLGQFTKDIREGKEERGYLRDSLSRVTQQFKVVKEEVDLHTDTLINKMNEVSEKVNRLVSKVGESSIQNAELERRIQRSGGGKKGAKSVQPDTF